MQFKSENSLFASIIKKWPSVVFLMLFAQSGWAGITVSATDQNGNLYNNSSNSTFYYPVLGATSHGTLASSISQLASGEPPEIVLTDSQGLNSNGSIQVTSSPLTSNLLFFTVSGDSSVAPSPPSGSSLYVMVYSGTTAEPLPIAYYGTAAPGGTATLNACVSGSGFNGNASCTLNYTDTSTTPNSGYSYAVPYPSAGTNLVIGMSPLDICASLGADAPTSFCTSSAVTTPTAAAAATLQMSFYMVSIPSGFSGFAPNSFPATTNSSTNVTFYGPSAYGLSLVLYPPSSTITCPDIADASYEQNFYFPGDGQIFLNTTNFAYSGATNAGSAPQWQLVVYAESPASTSGSGQLPTLSNSTLFQTVALNVGLGSPGGVPITGLTDSTSSTKYFYNFGFGIEDYAGFVTANSPASLTSCQLNNVEVTAIQGFLGDSKCFIATAAYRSANAAPVLMLRRFRDQILLHTILGKKFVAWYYSWSPAAADWLIDHPIFRYPVLVALIPVEIFAWLCLNPLVFLMLSIAFLFFTVWLKYREAAREEAEFEARVRGEWP